MHYHAQTGNCDLTFSRDDNSLVRSGDPALYRYQVQGPKALDVMRKTTAWPASQGSRCGAPGSDNDVVLAALLDAGEAFDLTRVGANVYHTNAVESGWLPRPLPAIYTDERLAGYREWLDSNA